MVTIPLFRLFFAYDPAQVLTIGDRIRMLRPKHVLTDAQCLLAQRLAPVSSDPAQRRVRPGR